MTGTRAASPIHRISSCISALPPRGQCILEFGNIRSTLNERKFDSVRVGGNEIQIDPVLR
jgi:hypothetical protein